MPEGPANQSRGALPPHTHTEGLTMTALPYWIECKAIGEANESYFAVYAAEAPADDPDADRVWEQTYANWVERCKAFYAALADPVAFDALPVREQIALVY